MRQQYPKNTFYSISVKFFISLFFILTMSPMYENISEACPACDVGSGPDNERDNKSLADLQKIFEEKGKDALPNIREAFKTSKDPLVIKRSANFLVVLNDTESIPKMESMLLELVKPVTYTAFGPGATEFQSRLAVAHAMIKFGPTTVGHRIWEKYGRLDLKRKEEVPFILSALKDPHLDERMIIILNKAEDYRLMQGALEALAGGGSDKILPYLRAKIEAWQAQGLVTGSSAKPGAPMIDYSSLILKAEIAIHHIGKRFR